MKAIKCEICGSVDLLKQDGVYVCQHCRASYSVEEAKKLMVEIEGTVEVQGTVKVDDTDKIGNYWTLAKDAYEAGEKEKAVEYCDKILELDSTYYKAYEMKASAKIIAWSWKHARIEEVTRLYDKAVEYVPEQERGALMNRIAKKIDGNTKFMIEEKISRFGCGVKSENWIDVIDALIAERNQLFSRYGLTEQDEQYVKSIWATLGVAAVDRYNAAYKDYNRAYSIGSKPSESDWDEFSGAMDSCILITKKAIETQQDKPEKIIPFYKNLILYTEKKRDSIGLGVAYGQRSVLGFSKVAKQEMQSDIESYHQKISELDPNYKREEPRKKAGTGCKNTGLALMSMAFGIICIGIMFIVGFHIF